MNYKKAIRFNRQKYGEGHESWIRLIQNMVGVDPDGVIGVQTVRAIAKWQKEEGLVDDGMFGDKSENYARENKLFPKALSEPSDDKLKWVECPAEEMDNGHGYDYTTLRADVAEKYLDLYQEIHDLGGTITSAGGRRRLSTGTSENRSSTSLHYLGRAFDLATYSGMQHPESDPFVIGGLDDRKPGNVFVRAVDAPLRDLAAHVRGKHPVTTTDNFHNFTLIAKGHGFTPIPPRRNWRRVYGATEWWHFEYHKGLEIGETTFGSELLKIYSLEEINKHRHIRRVLSRKWNGSRFA
jgi:hypothetical protein